MPLMADIKYDRLPEELRGGMQRYIEHGIQPGHFLTAVLENNFLEAFNRADSGNIFHMLDIVMFMYNQCPMDAWGSPAKVDEWMKHQGFEGWGKN